MEYKVRSELSFDVGLFDDLRSWADFSGFGQSNLSQHWADQFINQHGKEGDISNQLTLFAHGLGYFHGHTQGNAGLRQQGNTQILADHWAAFGQFRADEGAEDLARGAEENVGQANAHNSQTGEYTELQFGAAENEEQNIQRGCPFIRSVHHILREVTDVAENGAGHHADKQRREADGDAAQVEAEHGECDGEHNKGNDDGQTAAVGIEIFFQTGQDKAHNRTQDQGSQYFNQWFYQNGNDADRTAHQGSGNTGGNREDNQSDGVIQSDDRQQDGGERTFGFVLFYNHQGSCRSGSGCDGAKHDGHWNGDDIRHQEVKHHHYNIHQKGSHKSLYEGNNSSLETDAFQLREPELVTDIKGDEAQSHITEYREGFYMFGAYKAQTGDLELSQYIRADQNTGDQVSGDGRKLQFFRHTGQQKARNCGDAQTKQ